MLLKEEADKIDLLVKSYEAFSAALDELEFKYANMQIRLSALIDEMELFRTEIKNDIKKDIVEMAKW
jgi:hypothetical protein